MEIAHSRLFTKSKNPYLATEAESSRASLLNMKSVGFSLPSFAVKKLSH
jgi:hypothetical protein